MWPELNGCLSVGVAILHDQPFSPPTKKNPPISLFTRRMCVHFICACVCMCGISCVRVYTNHVMTLYIHVDDTLPNAALISSSSWPRTSSATTNLHFLCLRSILGSQDKGDEETGQTHSSLIPQSLLLVIPGHGTWAGTALTARWICSLCLCQ